MNYYRKTCKCGRLYDSEDCPVCRDLAKYRVGETVHVNITGTIVECTQLNGRHFYKLETGECLTMKDVPENSMIEEE